jgi:hypothetical protein
MGSNTKLKLESLLLYEPHNMLISGITNCGKTYFVLDLIKKYNFSKSEYIVLFCPTYFLNSTYIRKWLFLDNHAIIINPDSVKKDLDSVLKFASEVFSSSKTLFIIDDCSNLHDLKRKNSELCNLAFSGRHSNLTVWVINQKYNSVVKDYRENMRMLILFYNPDEKAMKFALEDNAIIPKEKRSEVLEILKSNKTAKLIIRREYPRSYLIT